MQVKQHLGFLTSDTKTTKSVVVATSEESPRLISQAFSLQFAAAACSCASGPKLLESLSCSEVVIRTQVRMEIRFSPIIKAIS